MSDKRYWLTPPDLMAALQQEFQFDFDPCPYPRPEGFDGLLVEWGKSNYVNPLFGGSKGDGHTAWTRKALEEQAKGKKAVIVFPVHKWVLRLIAHATEIRNLGDVRWCAIEDGTPGKGIGFHIAAFILDPK